MKLYIPILFLLILSSAYSRKDFTGKVFEQGTEQSLPGASVRIENTQYGANVNSKGIFTIKNLPQNFKNGTLIISMIGYESIKKRVDFDSDNAAVYYLKVQPLQTGEVIVSANKKVQAIQDVPISVSVIDKRVLIDRGINRLDDALEYVPGIEVNQDDVSIRGSAGFSFGVGSRVTLLIDGFPMMAGDNGDIKFDALPIFNIDRIEVVKGAGSALWGTGAIGGVINLMIEEPNEKANIKYRAFSGLYTQPRYEQWRFTDGANLSSGLNLSYSQKFNKLSLVTSGSLYGDQGYRDFDDNFRWNLFSKVGYEFSADTKLKVILNGALEDRADWVYWNSLDSATRPPTSANRDIRIDSYKYSAFSELSHSFNQNHFGLVKLGINQTQYNNSYPLDNPEYRQSDATAYFAELQGVSNFGILGRGINLTYGASQVYTDVKSFTYGDRYQHIVSGYAQAEYSLPDVFTLTFGGRLDKELTEGIESDLEFSPKVGINVPVAQGLNLRASAGRGFRVAAVAERYSAILLQGFEVLPNPDLKPETSWSYEAGGSWQTLLGNTPFEIDFVVFNNDLENLIEPTFVTDGAANIQFRNVVKARIQGVETGLRTLLFGAVGLETSLTLMNPRDLSTDRILNYRSEVLWYSRVLLPLKYFEFQIDYRYKSRVQNIDAQLGLIVRDTEARVDMNVVDVRLIFDMKKLADLPFRFTLNANNLFDYYYTEMVGNLARTRYLSLQFDGEL
ncbi:MAG: TonB-dependent receptor [Candidatus Kapabacteria bacterium]|nr:TonB-dependent receptor [Ignavibacteriota bacterium]MCW5885959.1 TonB-dependent receptor [Candidatus Kapabacteria bacterium]